MISSAGTRLRPVFATETHENQPGANALRSTKRLNQQPAGPHEPESAMFILREDQNTVGTDCDRPLRNESVSLCAIRSRLQR